MSLASNLQSALTRVGTEFKTVYGRIGTLANLTTANKANLVAAINEVNNKPTSSGGAQINDTTPSTTTAYSATRTETRLSEVAAATKADILGGAGVAQDTLAELKAYADALDSANDTEIQTAMIALGNRVRFDAQQSLTAEQKVQANVNIGSLSLVEAGDPNTDFVATFQAALV